MKAGLEGEPRWLTGGEQQAWRAYLRGSRLVEEALDRDLQKVDVQLSEYEIISMLSEEPARRVRMSSLANQVVQSRSRLTHTASRLEKRGWVRREPCLDDRRGVDLVLTDDGIAAVHEMSRLHVESVRRNLVDLLTPDQFAALGEAMGVLETELRQATAGTVR